MRFSLLMTIGKNWVNSLETLALLAEFLFYLAGKNKPSCVKHDCFMSLYTINFFPRRWLLSRAFKKAILYVSLHSFAKL